MKQEKLVPELRFKNYNHHWDTSILKNLTSYVDYRGRGPEKSDEGIFLVTAKNIKKGYIDMECSKEYIPRKNKDVVLSKGLPEKGDILFTTEAPLGNVAMVMDDDIALAQRVIKFRAEPALHNRYLLFYMLSSIYQNLILKKAIGSTVLGISGKELHKTIINFPSLPEQQKIADFLTSVDQKIQALTRKVELLKDYKKGVMQKVFKQEVRFRDDDGGEFSDWEERKFLEIFNRVKTKNKEDNQTILTISSIAGLVSQQDYFNKIVAAKDVTNYYLINKNDFAYNKSYSKGYPMGSIQRLKDYDKGVLSTLYICFRAKNNYNFKYFDVYFDAQIMNKPLSMIAQEGVRNHGLLNMSVIDFFNIKIKVPSLAEQTKIANFFTLIDDKISAVEGKLEKMKEWKKGLLQTMFV